MNHCNGMKESFFLSSKELICYQWSGDQHFFANFLAWMSASAWTVSMPKSKSASSTQWWHVQRRHSVCHPVLQTPGLSTWVSLYAHHRIGRNNPFYVFSSVKVKKEEVTLYPLIQLSVSSDYVTKPDSFNSMPFNLFWHDSITLAPFNLCKIS